HPPHSTIPQTCRQRNRNPQSLSVAVGVGPGPTGRTQDRIEAEELHDWLDTPWRSLTSPQLRGEPATDPRPRRFPPRQPCLCPGRRTTAPRSSPTIPTGTVERGRPAAVGSYRAREGPGVHTQRGRARRVLSFGRRGRMGEPHFRCPLSAPVTP